jgi:hypothetical protein
MIRQQLYRNGDDLYLILREVEISRLMDKVGQIRGEAFNALKDYLRADKVLKNQTHFLFCETIQEVDWQDIPEEHEEQKEP